MSQDLADPAPHIIRLRGPWEGPDARVKLPGDWQSTLGECVAATLARRFNRPTGLMPGQPVCLRVASQHRLVAVRLNGSPVELNAGAADVGGLLQHANRLEVELERTAANHDSLLEVQLEIAPS